MPRTYILERLSFTNTANSKRQIQVAVKTEKEQINTARKLMDKNLCETTNLCVEIMNSKRQVKVKLGQVHVQIRVSRLT